MPSCKVHNQLTFSDNLGVLSLSTFSPNRSGQAFNYNETAYVAALNRALQLEHTAVAIYAAKQRRPIEKNARAGATAIDRTESHHKALRQLVQLIFAQRGLPDSDPSGLTAFTGTVAAKVSRYMPPVVQDPMLGVSAQRIEYALARRYRQLLKIAPEGDRQIIIELLNQVSAFSSQSF